MPATQLRTAAVEKVFILENYKKFLETAFAHMTFRHNHGLSLHLGKGDVNVSYKQSAALVY